MPIDNFEKIKTLLKFETEDDFYFLQVIQRKKDHKAGKVNGTNNNSRLIKAYYVSSLEYLEFVRPEVIELCKAFNARAGIDLNRRSYEQIAFRTLQKVTDQIINKDFNKVHKAYSTVCGKHSNESKDGKRWIIDIDRDDNGEFPVSIVSLVAFIESKCEPIGKKYITKIPSKNGVHLITKPFNRKTFSDKYPDVEVHMKNPTNLFIP